MGTDELPFDPALLRAGQVVADLVYHPLETALLRAAAARGCTTVDGLGMLVHQAVAAAAAVDRRARPTRRRCAPPPSPSSPAAPDPRRVRDGQPPLGDVGSASNLAAMLRFLTAGESHGQALVVIVEGLPAGLAVTVEDIQAELARRRLGYGRGPRQRFEVDELTLLGGVRHGRTLGSPVAIEIKNTEWFRSDKWHAEMSPAPGATAAPLTQVRPGHADLAGMQKYGFTDARDVLERASARETAARVAAGAVAKLLLAELGDQRAVARRADGPGPLDGTPARRSSTSRTSTSRRCAASIRPRPRR